jgi:hypothetical protein
MRREVGGDGGSPASSAEGEDIRRRHPVRPQIRVTRGPEIVYGYRSTPVREGWRD